MPPDRKTLIGRTFPAVKYVINEEDVRDYLTGERGECNKGKRTDPFPVSLTFGISMVLRFSPSSTSVQRARGGRGNHACPERRAYRPAAWQQGGRHAGASERHGPGLRARR